MMRKLRTAIFTLSMILISTAALAAGQAYKLRVDGLACPFCAYGIEKQLSRIEGIKQIEVDIRTGTVAVIMVDGAILDEATAEKAVKAAGFSLRGFEKVQATTQNKPGN